MTPSGLTLKEYFCQGFKGFWAEVFSKFPCRSRCRRGSRILRILRNFSTSRSRWYSSSSRAFPTRINSFSLFRRDNLYLMLTSVSARSAFRLSSSSTAVGFGPKGVLRSSNARMCSSFDRSRSSSIGVAGGGLLGSSTSSGFSALSPMCLMLEETSASSGLAAAAPSSIAICAGKVIKTSFGSDEP